MALQLRIKPRAQRQIERAARRSDRAASFLSFYRRATVPVTPIEREVCSPVISEGIGGAGAYTSPEAGGSDWCPGLTKANNGGLSLGVCEKAVVYMQPYSVTSTSFTPPTTMKISLQ